MCCDVIRSIVQPTDANKREFRKNRMQCYFFTKDCTSQGLPEGPRYMKIIY